MKITTEKRLFVDKILGFLNVSLGLLFSFCLPCFSVLSYRYLFVGLGVPFFYNFSLITEKERKVNFMKM